MPKHFLAFAIVLLANPLLATAFTYSEATQGDIASYDENAPTPMGALDAGANVLSGTVTSFVDWGDVFSVDVPLGLAITSVAVAISGHTGGFSATTKIFKTPVYYALDSQVFDADSGHFFDKIVPLAAPGPYGFTAAFLGAGMGDSYGWQWTITTIPEPSSAAGQLAAGATLAGAAFAGRRARRGRPSPRTV